MDYRSLMFLLAEQYLKNLSEGAMTNRTEAIEALERASAHIRVLWVEHTDDADRLDALAKALREGQEAWEYYGFVDLQDKGHGDKSQARRVLVITWGAP